MSYFSSSSYSSSCALFASIFCCNATFAGDTSPTHNTHSVAMGITTMFHVSHAGVVPGAAVAVLPPGAALINPNSSNNGSSSTIQPVSSTTTIPNQPTHIGQQSSEQKGF